MQSLSIVWEESNMADVVRILPIDGGGIREIIPNIVLQALLGNTKAHRPAYLGWPSDVPGFRTPLPPPAEPSTERMNAVQQLIPRRSTTVRCRQKVTAT
jgi:hypothetical protein